MAEAIVTLTDAPDPQAQAVIAEGLRRWGINLYPDGRRQSTAPSPSAPRPTAATPLIQPEPKRVS